MPTTPPFAARITSPHQLQQAQQRFADHHPRPWLVSPPAAAARHGLGWWQSLLCLADHGWILVLDCADSPGLCLSAIRHRIPAFCATLPPDQQQAIHSMAEQVGCQFLPPPTTYLCL